VLGVFGGGLGAFSVSLALICYHGS